MDDKKKLYSQRQAFTQNLPHLWLTEQQKIISDETHVFLS